MIVMFDSISLLLYYEMLHKQVVTLNIHLYWCVFKCRHGARKFICVYKSLTSHDFFVCFLKYHFYVLFVYYTYYCILLCTNAAQIRAVP